MRSTTSVAVVLACGLAGWMGTDLVRFDFAQRLAAPSLDGAKALRAWRDVPGLGEEAQEAAISVPTELTGSMPLRFEALDDVLGRRPLAAAYWLALAKASFYSGVSTDRVLAALNLSGLTGPNEGRLKILRATFALTLWDQLNEEQRMRVVADLAAGSEPLSYASARERLEFAHAISSKPVSVRRQLRTMLGELHGLSDRELTLLGL